MRKEKKEFSKAQREALIEFVKRRDVLTKQLNDFVDYLYAEHGITTQDRWIIAQDLTGIEKIVDEKEIINFQETPGA